MKVDIFGSIMAAIILAALIGILIIMAVVIPRQESGHLDNAVTIQCPAELIQPVPIGVYWEVPEGVALQILEEEDVKGSCEVR